MFDLTHYFHKDNTLYPSSGLIFWVFDSTKVTNFVQDCLIPFREAYIEETKLVEIVNDYKTLREDEIAERLPGSGDVKSGDFGEILSFYMACQIWSPTANVTPMKWRFKDNKKAASSYTDIVLFQCPDSANPSSSDAMFTYEVKTRAGKLGNKKYFQHVKPSYITYKDGKDECTILEAVYDANKDAVGRAAETIPYLLTRCKDVGYSELYHQIYRFGKASKVTHQKQYNAVAIVESSHLADQISRIPVDLFSSHPLVTNVYCLPIEHLKAVYLRIFNDMPTKA